MSSPAVVCYGELGVDNLIRVPHLPSPERAAFPTEDRYAIGGAAANTAVWLSGWGVPVRLLGNAVGQDDLGRRFLAWLKAYPDLDASFIQRRRGASTPFCRILITPDGERTILVFGYPQAPKRRLTPRALDGARYLALDLYGGEERLEAARAGRRAGARTVVNDILALDHPVLPLTDIAVNSAAYLRETFPGADAVEYARALQGVSGGAVVTTDGPNPVHVLESGGRSTWVQPPAVEPVDATGAGDAFRAGLIYGLLQGWPLLEAAAFGAAAGALKVTRPQSVPSVAQVRARTAKVVPPKI